MEIPFHADPADISLPIFSDIQILLLDVPLMPIHSLHSTSCHKIFYVPYYDIMYHFHDTLHHFYDFFIFYSISYSMQIQRIFRFPPPPISEFSCFIFYWRPHILVVLLMPTHSWCPINAHTLSIFYWHRHILDVPSTPTHSQYSISH